MWGTVRRIVVLCAVIGLVLMMVPGLATARFSSLQNFFLGGEEDGLQICRDGAVLPVAYFDAGTTPPTTAPEGPEVVVPFVAEYPPSEGFPPPYPPSSAATIAAQDLTLPFSPIVWNAPTDPGEDEQWAAYSARPPAIGWTNANGEPLLLDVGAEVGLYFDQPGDDDVSFTVREVTDCRLFPDTPTSVTVDVRPASSLNIIVPKSLLPVPVAVLSSAAFDARTIDRSSLRFEGARPRWSFLLDVNHDGRRDLVAGFRARDTDIRCGDTSATLTGTAGGVDFEGTDAIITLGCRRHR